MRGENYYTAKEILAENNKKFLTYTLPFQKTTRLISRGLDSSFCP